MAIDLETQIMDNLKFSLDLDFLDAGFFFNVLKDQLDFSGNEESLLTRITNDPTFSQGRIYQSVHKNWIYEEDIVVPSGFEIPIIASGVYVNDIFKLRTDPTFGHSIDYPNGRIIFDSASAVSTTDVVKTDFGVKTIWITESTKSAVAMINEMAALNTDIQNLQAVPSGLALPAILIERVRSTSEPLQLGGGKISGREISFHIVTRDAHILKPVSFILTELEDKTLKLVNWATAPFPLDEFGDKTASYIEYRILQDTQRLNGLIFRAMEGRAFPTDLPLEIETIEGQVEVRRKDA